MFMSEHVDFMWGFTVVFKDTKELLTAILIREYLKSMRKILKLNILNEMTAETDLTQGDFRE